MSEREVPKNEGIKLCFEEKSKLIMWIVLLCLNFIFFSVVYGLYRLLGGMVLFVHVYWCLSLLNNVLCL